MLTVKFEGHPEAVAIILDSPAHATLSGKGVTGMVECAICGEVDALYHEGEDQLAYEIEEFIKGHNCLPLAREAEVLAFTERLKKSAPTMIVRVWKGKKIIHEASAPGVSELMRSIKETLDKAPDSPLKAELLKKVNGK